VAALRPDRLVLGARHGRGAGRRRAGEAGRRRRRPAPAAAPAAGANASWSPPWSLYDRAERAWRGHESTGVEFLEPDDAALRRYVATGEPRDKAGAYGIQGYGALMVRRVEGCYFNVMGLPLALLGGALRATMQRRRDRERA
jgi:hypothetical protein